MPSHPLASGAVAAAARTLAPSSIRSSECQPLSRACTAVLPLVPQRASGLDGWPRCCAARGGGELREGLRKVQSHTGAEAKSKGAAIATWCHAKRREREREEGKAPAKSSQSLPVAAVDVCALPPRLLLGAARREASTLNPAVAGTQPLIHAFSMLHPQLQQCVRRAFFPQLPCALRRSAAARCMSAAHVCCTSAGLPACCITSATCWLPRPPCLPHRLTRRMVHPFHRGGRRGERQGRDRHHP